MSGQQEVSSNTLVNRFELCLLLGESEHTGVTVQILKLTALLQSVSCEFTAVLQ